MGGGGASGEAARGRLPEPGRQTPTITQPLPARLALPLLWTLMTGVPRQGHCHTGNEVQLREVKPLAKATQLQTAELGGSESRAEARGSLPTPEPARSPACWPQSLLRPALLESQVHKDLPGGTGLPALGGLGKGRPDKPKNGRGWWADPARVLQGGRRAPQSLRLSHAGWFPQDRSAQSVRSPSSL